MKLEQAEVRASELARKLGGRVERKYGHPGRYGTPFCLAIMRRTGNWLDDKCLATVEVDNNGLPDMAAAEARCDKYICDNGGTPRIVSINMTDGGPAKRHDEAKRRAQLGKAALALIAAGDATPGLQEIADNAPRWAMKHKPTAAERLEKRTLN